MKKTFFTLATLCLLGNIALSQNTLRIHKSDGSKLELPLNSIDSLSYFQASQQVNATQTLLTWNEIAVNTAYKAGLNGNHATRLEAISSIAVYDAVNSIRDFGDKYHFYQQVSGPVSIQAAVAQAAHDVLVNYVPQRKSVLDSLLNVTLNSITEAGVVNGQNLGAASAADIIALRNNDGALPDVTYPGPATPGVGEWRPTPSGFTPGATKQWGLVKPFALTSNTQFRPIAPPTVGSAAYNTALEEVRTLGAANSSVRTADQTHVAQFYKQAAESVVNEAARILIQRHNTPLEEAAYILLLANIAQADARIALFDAKYYYNFWRPVTALNAETDGSVTNNYAAWSALIPTPAHPSYPSGHSGTATAGFEVLKNFFGDQHTLTLTTPQIDVLSRTVASLSTADAENGQSRIYAGVHYQFDNTSGQDIGRKVAQFVISSGPQKHQN